ncbi:hypothetical protein O9A_00980 [Bartonella koehlerae C-29]|uniref:Uncharacterized protein n=1 Tax=Bartonella koehlerae C-29 TaxID=1134510 RepID=A0A067W5A7_9HYPH|nr:hypothetical protein O9A_00980 [Bartonella koehlerae C-29]
MLLSLHGNGFIRFDRENFSESQIMISAKERNDTNWDIVNRLLKKNKNFFVYIKLIHQFYQTGESHQFD